jgi:hypothetical protein
MDALHGKSYFIKSVYAFAFTLLTLVMAYLLIKPAVKLVLIDVINIPQALLARNEQLLFWIYVIVLSPIITFILVRLATSDSNTPSNKIVNQIQRAAYLYEDYRKVELYYKTFIRNERTQVAKKYYDVSKYYPKSVYALTGGWRAGKTTSAGMLLDVIRNDKSIEVGSETYHDCFNFGNIDESISIFFRTLSIKTGITEFNELGQVTTPRLDMGVSLGFLSFKKVFSKPIWANEIRSRIFTKLHDQKKVHVFIVDDIDRLMPSEQYQWLKVIEILGKFHNNLVLILPIHIEEVTKNLYDAYNLNPNYIDKIIPTKNRLAVGVDISYIKSLMSVSGRSPKRIKRIYTKYLISLALRQSISRQATRPISRKGEWYNEVYRGGISEIARVFSDKIPRRAGIAEQLSIMGMNIGKDETIWFKENRVNYETSKLNGLLKSRFLTPIDSRNNDEIGESNFHNLRTVDLLYSIFGQQSYQVYSSGTHYGAMPTGLDDSAWRDYWNDALWPIARSVKNDTNLSQLFTYQDIDKEISALMKANSEADEQRILAGFVLQWKY